MSGRGEGRTALITGIAGQDGTCLASLLLDKGYSVVGTCRSEAPSALWRLVEAGVHEHPRLTLERLDLADQGRCLDVIEKYAPDEVYNLGGLSYIARSFIEPVQTAHSTGLGAMNLLEAIRLSDPGIRFFQASSSEIFGNPLVSPQDENTPFSPRSPYAVSKLFAHGMAISYRESYGLFAANGILFNHESPFRSVEFVTRKISDAVARIKLGLQDAVELGNLDAFRDWGYAPEYVEGMWRMLQAGEADSFVLATGRLTSVREFAVRAFKAAGMDIIWQGRDGDETGRDADTGTVRVRLSKAHFRPAEVRPLCGNAGKAERLLGWKASVGIDEICRLMVEADLKRIEKDGTT